MNTQLDNIDKQDRIEAAVREGKKIINELDPF